jgi:hypothetical protein
MRRNRSLGINHYSQQILRSQQLNGSPIYATNYRQYLVQTSLTLKKFMETASSTNLVTCLRLRPSSNPIPLLKVLLQLCP